MAGEIAARGSRRQVWNRTAKRTNGGLKREDLFQDKYGNIKSKKASKNAKRNKNLIKAGYTTQKGKFGAVKIEDVKKSKKSSKKKSSKKKSPKKSKKRGGSYRRKRTLRGGDSCTGVPGHEHP
tara:strand:+ start:119 stop:487 length:369 start_codon:yes stop_codon:yes gene_type:complete